MPRSLPLVVSLLLVCLAPFARAEDSWHSTEWNGEHAWVSRHGAVEAIVSVERSRVIYFGSADGQHNLLSAPKERGAATREVVSPNWGGHRFWLGPQSRWNWPPPVEWEHAAADSAEAHDGVLTLKEHRTDPAYPALERDYGWDGDRLRCTGRWPASNRVYYAMHVIAVEAPAVIKPKLFVWEHVPQGVVGIRGDHPNAQNPLPNPAVQVEGDRAVIHSGITMVKLGFYPQSLTIARDGWQLFVSPGPIHGMVIESPDFGYLTQVWVDQQSNFSELEQITPYVMPAADGWCGSSIYLEARPQ